MVRAGESLSLTTAQVRAVAAAASCDYRTVRRYLRGEPIRVLLAQQRIEAALVALGLTQGPEPPIDGEDAPEGENEVSDRVERLVRRVGGARG